MFFAFARLTRRAIGKWETTRQQQTELFGFVGDCLAARDDLLALDRSQWAARRAGSLLDSLYRVEGRAYLAGRAAWPLTQLFFALSFGLALGFGLQRLGHNGITAGTLTMLYLYVGLLQDPLENLSSQADQLQRMAAILGLSAKTLSETAAAPARTAGPVALPDGPPTVAFDNVTFGYGADPVLHGVSFTVPAGRSLGIVGPTGAGKSTVINLLCGLAAPGQGRVTIDGVDPAAIAPADLGRHLTVLSQQAHLFAASIRENITLFDGAVATEQVWQVLERLGAAGWVRDLPDGLDTRVGDGGRQLSMGETQLLAGARALLRPVGLLMIDEGTSRLDPETERTWSKVLDTLMRDRTVIMVAHRLATLRGIDEILILKDGAVVDLVPGSEVDTLDGRAGVAR